MFGFVWAAWYRIIPQPSNYLIYIDIYSPIQSHLVKSREPARGHHATLFQCLHPLPGTLDFLGQRQSSQVGSSRGSPGASASSVLWKRHNSQSLQAQSRGKGGVIWYVYIWVFCYNPKCRLRLHKQRVLTFPVGWVWFARQELDLDGPLISRLTWTGFVWGRGMVVGVVVLPLVASALGGAFV